VTAQVDVQGGVNSRFVVQVHAIGEHREKAVIDRFAITESERQGGDRRLRCGPNLTLYVGPTGVLFVEKSQGWATVDITATCQLKERS
jgi:hypothetical protein